MRAICASAPRSSYAYTPSGARPAQLASPGRRPSRCGPETRRACTSCGVRRPGVRLFFGLVGSHPLGRSAASAPNRPRRPRSTILRALEAASPHASPPRPRPSRPARATSKNGREGRLRGIRTAPRAEEARRGAERRAERHAAARFGGCAAEHAARRGGCIRPTKHRGAKRRGGAGSGGAGSGSEAEAPRGRDEHPRCHGRQVSPPQAEHTEAARGGVRRTATRRRICIRREYPPSAQREPRSGR